jgi:hypothetical protein
MLPMPTMARLRVITHYLHYTNPPPIPHEKRVLVWNSLPVPLNRGNDGLGQLLVLFRAWFASGDGLGRSDRVLRRRNKGVGVPRHHQLLCPGIGFWEGRVLDICMRLPGRTHLVLVKFIPAD